MTEIPEHLLKRSQARRAAKDGDAAESTDAAPAASTAPVPAAAAAAPVQQEAPAAPPKPVAPYVAAANARKKMPLWIVPVLLCLPIWGIFLVGTLDPPTREATGLLAEGQEVYAGSCAGCHGGAGQGGVGPQLNEGEVLLTFPEVYGQLAWVINGSPAVNGTPYGSPDRPDGQRLSEGGMGPWVDSLSAEELAAAVYYERVTHGGLEGEEAAFELELIEAWLGSENHTFAAGQTTADVEEIFAPFAAELAEEAAG